MYLQSVKNKGHCRRRKNRLIQVEEGMLKGREAAGEGERVGKQEGEGEAEGGEELKVELGGNVL